MADQQNSPPLTAPSDEPVAKYGDLVLVVGTGEEEIKLHVYSQCLKAASKVFTAMLTPPWKEGQDLVHDEEPKVLLPEDDPHAMRQICRVLHHQGMADGDVSSPEQLLRMSILADKYDLCDALEPHVPLRLNTISPITSAERMYCYVALCRFGYRAQKCSWLFDLVGKQTESFEELLDENLIEMTLKFRDLNYLEKVRTRLRLTLTEYFVTPSCVYGCHASKNDSLETNIAQLKKAYSGPKIIMIPVVEVMEKLKGLYAQIRLDQSEPCRQAAKEDFVPHETPKYTACMCGKNLYRAMDDLYASTISDIITGIPK